MKTFRQFMCEAEDARNAVQSLRPFRVMPPLRKSDGSYNPAPKRYLIDPITGFGPGDFKQAQVKTKTKIA